MTDRPQPWFYEHLASWWPLWSPVESYREEAAFYGRVLKSAGTAPAGTLLELGSGGGHNAFFMKGEFDLTLVEPSAGMREISAALNPECRHVEGDMRTVRLERTFDRVFVHDAVVYMTTETDLRAAIETAWVHTRPGGAVLMAPDYVSETFRPGTGHGGADQGNRGLRYLEWVHDPDPSDTTYTVDYAFLLREGDGVLRIEHDRHVEGLFSRADWTRMLEEAGFRVTVMPLEHSEVEPGTHEVFVGVRAPSTS